MITVEQLENYKKMYKYIAPNVLLDLIAEIERLQAIEKTLMAYLLSPAGSDEVVQIYFELCRACGVKPQVDD